MNIHTPSIFAESAVVHVPDGNGRVWVHIGAALLSMSVQEARDFARKLQDAARGGDPLVKLDGLHVANDDLVPAERATREAQS